MNTISITLSTDQLEAAYALAEKRNEGAIISGRRDKHGALACDALDHHIVGSIGEWVAKVGMGLDQELTCDTYRDSPDISPCPQFPDGAEVRARGGKYADMIVRLDDDPDKIFISVHVNADRTGGTILGYISGAEALSNPAWRHRHGGRPEAAFVPREALRPLVQAKESE